MPTHTKTSQPTLVNQSVIKFSSTVSICLNLKFETIQIMQWWLETRPHLGADTTCFPFQDSCVPICLSLNYYCYPLLIIAICFIILIFITDKATNKMLIRQLSICADRYTVLEKCKVCIWKCQGWIKIEKLWCLLENLSAILYQTIKCQCILLWYCNSHNWKQNSKQWN